jgi:hypothetical protein
MVELPWRRYAPWLESMQDPAMGVTQEGFQQYYFETSHGRDYVRSMLSPFELALLYGVCRHNYRGHGEIVDGGPLLGLGTYALARGLAHNDHTADKYKRIYSFDLWLSAGFEGYTQDRGSSTGSVLERFLEVNRDYLDEIYLSPGDLLTMKWETRPIEILFVDIAKSLDLNAWVLKNWFTSLIPGESILIQQDYVHFAEWWIAVTMQYFWDYFERIEFVYGASAVYRCIRSISPNEVTKFLKLSHADHTSLMRDAISTAPASVAEVLKCGLAALLMKTDLLAASRVLESVRCDIRHSDPVQDFSEIAKGNLQLVTDLLNQAAHQKLGRSAL